MEDSIVIRGARQHNLKGVSLTIPRNKMVVITGISGSGKSSLAFDTIYAEGQRRYVESLSAYARQFLEQMQKPDVEHIEGLPPTIAIEQRRGHSTPRSTVATTTEIYDYLRVLFARIGHAKCYRCGQPVTRQSSQEITDHILTLPKNTQLTILSPVVIGKKGHHRDIFQRAKNLGFPRVRVDGKFHEVKDVPPLNRFQKHDISICVDRLVITENSRRRVADSVELALKLADGKVEILFSATTQPGGSVPSAGSGRGGQENGAEISKIFSEQFACPKCGTSFGEIQPRTFSFNSPYGACPACNGLGTKLELDEDLIVPDREQPLIMAIVPFRKLGRRQIRKYEYKIREFCERRKIPVNTPFSSLPKEVRRSLMFGSKGEGGFEGVIPHLAYRFENTDSEFIKWRIMQFMTEHECPDCGGLRLRKEALAVTIGGKNISEICKLSVSQAIKFLDSLKLTAEEEKVARLVIREIKTRLRFLEDVGLGYITLDRKSETLAGGEAQRIRLGSQLGSGLVGVCYVLDEPTIGLHMRDNRRLIDALIKLRDLGNTVIVVEHDEDMIRAADWIIDLGPGAGRDGGYVVATGTPDEIMRNPASLTGAYLSGRNEIQIPVLRRKIDPDYSITVVGARSHNLKNIDVRIPLGVFVALTGVSGSGKSTLLYEILYKGISRKLKMSRIVPGEFKDIKGLKNITDVVLVDQSPIGRTPRSNPATYTGVLDEIRNVFAMTKESKMRGYTKSRFSFNVRGGRCESCEGQGVKVIEMHFLPDVYVTCDVCKGKRFNRETLDITFKGKSISDILDMTVKEALDFFAFNEKIVQILRTVDDVGLGYIQLGQPSTTLSGGEAQRMKLSSELAKKRIQPTLYLLDEPTTGLHFEDIKKLIAVLGRLVDMGHSVVVIEHNMHVIKTADWIIDLGPEGGDGGGEVIFEGTPEEIIRNDRSHTGRYLREFLEPAAKNSAAGD